MVLLSDSQRGDRRIQFKSLRGSSWRNSWRSSRTLDSSTKNDAPAQSIRKSVHFSVDVVDDDAPSTMYDMAAEEIQTLWYQSEDYAKFEKDRKLTSFGYVASKRGRISTFDPDSNSVRGLELLVDDRLGRRNAGERKTLKKALKAEEQRQKEESSFPDLEKFRKVSLQHTRGARDRAMGLAQQDAKEARASKDDFLMPLPRLRRS